MENKDLKNYSELQVFRRQILQLVPLKELQWPDNSVLRKLDSQEWLFDHLFNSERIKYQAPARYQMQILKELLARIESNISDPEQDEISENLTSAFVSFLSEPLPPESAIIQRRSYVTYSFPAISEEAAVTLLESRSIISSAGTTGLRTWEASLHFSYFLSSPHGTSFVSNKKVLELGSGTGLVSILCSKLLNAQLVFATDGSQDVVGALEDSLFLNDLQSRPNICARLLKWGTAIEPDESGQAQAFDTILGADVTYDPSIFPSLLWTFRELFDLNSKTVILVAATLRNEQTFSTFLDNCGKAGFSIETINFESPLEKDQVGPFYSTITPIRIVKITAPNHKLSDPFAV